MKLTTRFLILTGISGLAVILSLAIAYWGISTVNREFRNTYGEITGILTRLDLIKRNFEHQMQGLEVETHQRKPEIFFEPNERSGEYNDPSASGTVSRQQHSSLIPFSLTRMGRLNDEIRAISTELHNNPAFSKYTGIRTSDSIKLRIEELADRFEHCYGAIQANEDGELAAAFPEVRTHFEELHLFIESLEGRLLEDIGSSLDYAAETHFQVKLVLMMCLAVAALIAALVILLQGRWFNKPIRALRAATTELRQGNFAHRVPVLSRDELGLLSEEINEMASTIIQFQEQLLERERMAAVGEMMRRIVHNLRNPLAGIRSLAELTRSELEADSDEFENQDRIVRTVDRFEKWLEEVLHSTRSLEVRTELVATRSFIESALEPQQATAEGKAITFQIDLRDAPDDVCLDTVHFQHALVALVANAIEACPQSGTVRVIGRQLTSTTSPHNLQGQTNGNLPEKTPWELMIEDSGPGIDEEWRNRIFEPYFTTKRHGTGIGLAVVRNVVKAHCGEITVLRSELGGACFRVTLPG